MKRINIILIVVILALAGFTIYLIAGKKPNQPAPFQTTPNSFVAQPTLSPPLGGIVFSNNAFSPATIKFKTHNIVLLMFTNKSSANINIQGDASNASTVFNIGVLTPNQSKTITIDKPGKFSYSNKLEPSQKGTIEVIIE